MTEAPEGVRLAKRLAAELGCSRRTAELYIEGGWVRVDGAVVEAPGARVMASQQVVLAPGARAEEVPPVTLVLHKPAGHHVAPGGAQKGIPDALALLHAANRHAGEGPPVRVLQRHFRHLACHTPLPAEASGMVVYTQDARVARKLAEDSETLEQECIVQVAGQIAEGGLQRLCHGLVLDGRALPPIKVSWQSEQRLRFAGKGLTAKGLRVAVTAAGLQVAAVRRLRIGRVALGPLPPGQWRYLGSDERF